MPEYFQDTPTNAGGAPTDAPPPSVATDVPATASSSAPSVIPDPQNSTNPYVDSTGIMAGMFAPSQPNAVPVDNLNPDHTPGPSITAPYMAAITGPNKALANIQTPLMGGGFIGPDLGGAVKGDMLRRSEARADLKSAQDEASLGLATQDQMNKNDMEEIAAKKLGIDLEDLKMRKDEFGWKTEDRNRQQMIIKGLAKAGQQGGYGAAVDFLKTVDPMQAIQMETSKLSLDSDIMKNKVMQAQTPNMVNQAMLSSYAMLGRMDQAVMNAPADQRDAVYKASLPMRLQINPNAPKEYNTQAQANGLLSTSQSMPENVLWNTVALDALAKTDIGKNSLAMGAALKKDPTGQSPLVQGLIGERKSLEEKNLQNGLTNMKSQADINKKTMEPAQAQVKSTEAMNTNLEKANPGYNDFLKFYQSAKPNIDVISNDPDSVEAHAASQGLVANYAKYLSGPRVNPQMIHQAFIDNKKGDLYKYLQSQAGKSNVILSKTDMLGLAQVISSHADTMQKEQMGVEHQYKQSALDYNSNFRQANPNAPIDPINVGSLRNPSEQFYSIQNANSSGATQAGNNINMSSLPPNIQSAAQSALARGVPPAQVQQMINQVMQGGGNAPPASGAGKSGLANP